MPKSFCQYQFDMENAVTPPVIDGPPVIGAMEKSPAASHTKILHPRLIQLMLMVLHTPDFTLASDALIQPHGLYAGLGRDAAERQAAHRELSVLARCRLP